MQALIKVENLSLHIGDQDNFITPVKDLSFELFPGETLSILGESGSGKSLTALSLLQLLPTNSFFDKNSKILFEEKNLITLPENELQKIRGKNIAMIFQEPMTSLNPVLKVKNQMAEAIQLHRNLKKNEYSDEIDRLLAAVHISDIKRVREAYPHELSGGMRQRVMIAMCLAGQPKILIADEPTTALDVITQMQILELLKQIQAEYGMSILFITHDLRVAEKISDRIMIMYRGSKMEEGKTKDLIYRPKNPYTQHLFSVSPKGSRPPVEDMNECILSVENLQVNYQIKKGFFQFKKHYIPAVDNVTFKISEGETLGLVGASGSGKTSLAKAIMFLIPAQGGRVVFMNQSLTGLSAGKLRKKRSDFQMIFQDPYSAMDPRMRIIDILEEGMLALNIGSDANERRERVDVLLTQVGLNPNVKYRFPHQFSGGERQRLCIARALSVSPRLIVCDEPTSNLDASVAAEVIDLLLSLQTEFALSYLFITHNFSLVRTMAHRIMVMYEGKIVEAGNTEEVLHAPQHPYTQKLLKHSL